MSDALMSLLQQLLDEKKTLTIQDLINLQNIAFHLMTLEILSVGGGGFM